MANGEDFLKKYGDVSFTEMSFCDADSVVLCQMFYMAVEKVAPNTFEEEPMPFPEMAEKMFSYNGNKNVPVGVVLTKQISMRMMQMAKTRRYSEVKVTGVKEVFQVDPAIQFAGATFILPDDNIVVVFRGTDDSLIGWKEDVDILVKKGIPSHKLALDYLEEAASKFPENKLIVCGHSKGGNLALYAALNCSQETRDRIKLLYNNEGPGFHNFDYLDTKEYKELLPRYRHFVPQTSLVGMLLAHDDDYTVIKSNKLLGPMQHDLTTWQIAGNELVEKSDLTALAKIVDLGLMDFLLNVSDSDSNLIDRVFTEIIKASGQLTLTDLVKNFVPAAKGVKEAWTAYDDDTKEALKESFKPVKDSLLTAFKLVREDIFPTVAVRAKEFTNGLASLLD